MYREILQIKGVGGMTITIDVSSKKIHRQPVVVRATQHMEENIQKKHTLVSLAKEVGTNRNTLAMRFRSELGVGALDWLRRKRLHRAALLISTTDLDFQTISERVGYPYQANFCTAFKRYFGVSPRDFKCRHKSSQDKIISLNI